MHDDCDIFSIGSIPCVDEKQDHECLFRSWRRGVSLEVRSPSTLTSQSPFPKLGSHNPRSPRYHSCSSPKHFLFQNRSPKASILSTFPISNPETKIKMPLFGRHSAEEESAPPVPQKTVDERPKRSSTLFGRHRSVSPVSTAATERSRNSVNSSSGRRGLLHRNDADPSIRAAHDRVLSAEAAEREADKALMYARAAVKEAREQVKRLEREAAEE